MITLTTLTRFVKNECANFDRYYQSCVEGTPCKVLAGEQCGYFERSVLGPVDYKFRLPNYDYQKLFAQYADQTGKASEAVSQRLCECGKNLRPRQRLCDSCSEKRRRDAYRKYNRKRDG